MKGFWLKKILSQYWRKWESSKILTMNLKKVQIELDVSDVQKVLAIALDEDKDKALDYIKGNLVKQIKKALQPH